jgi:hypothetical protein
MSLYRAAATIVLGLLVFGCASAAGPRSVQQGMSRQVLMATMGEPDDRIIGPNYSAYKWTQQQADGADVDFWAILQDDVVVATGFGELHEDDQGHLTIVLLRR